MDFKIRRGGPRARPCPGLLAPCAIITLHELYRIFKSESIRKIKGLI